MVLAVWKDPLYLAMAYIWDNIDICSLVFYYTAQIIFFHLDLWQHEAFPYALDSHF